MERDEALTEILTDQPTEVGQQTPAGEVQHQPGDVTILLINSDEEFVDDVEKSEEKERREKQALIEVGATLVTKVISNRGLLALLVERGVNWKVNVAVAKSQDGETVQFPVGNIRDVVRIAAQEAVKRDAPDAPFETELDGKMEEVVHYKTVKEILNDVAHDLLEILVVCNARFHDLLELPETERCDGNEDVSEKIWKAIVNKATAYIAVKGAESGGPQRVKTTLEYGLSTSEVDLARRIRTAVSLNVIKDVLRCNPDII